MWVRQCLYSLYVLSSKIDHLTQIFLMVWPVDFLSPSTYVVPTLQMEDVCGVQHQKDTEICGYIQ